MERAGLEFDESIDAPQVPVVHLDPWLIAVHKPAGLLMHSTPLSGEREHFLVDMLRAKLGRQVYPVHRLDRPTSGIVALALDRRTAATLGRQFEARRVAKAYLAIVRGWLPAGGTIDHAIADRDNPGAGHRSAVTRYCCLGKTELDAAIETYPTSRFSLGLLWPTTGRRHQLRRHMKHVSHPIIGDTNYGRGPYNRYFRDQLKVRRLLLHAWTLRLEHPVTGAPLRLEAAPAGGFRDILSRFGWAEFDASAQAASLSEAD